MKKYRSERKGRRNFDTAPHYNTADMIATEKTPVRARHSYELNSRRCAVRRSPAWAAGGARRSTRASEHAGDRRPAPPGQRRAAGPPIQPVLRPLRHLVAYGRTNKYQPVTNCNMSGTSAKRPTQTVYFFCATATKLTITPTVKAMDSQRWVCRTHLFQFNGTSSDDGPQADRAHLQALRNRLRRERPARLGYSLHLVTLGVPWGSSSHPSTLRGVGRPTGALNTELLGVLGVQSLPAAELHQMKRTKGASRQRSSARTGSQVPPAGRRMLE